MPVHPEYVAFLKMVAEAAPPAGVEIPVADSRASYCAMRPAAPELAVAAVQDRTIPGPVGAIPIRIYTPSGRGPFPILVYFHGGGWMIGDLDTHDTVSREFCIAWAASWYRSTTGSRPSIRIPAALDDLRGNVRVADHAADIGGDPKRIAVGGDSAGGKLAAVVSHIARDRDGPTITFQLLAYPVTDATFSTARSASMRTVIC